MRITPLLATLVLLAGCSATPGAVVTVTAPATASSEATASETASYTPTPIVPTKDDFEIKLKVTSKQCFGSAGCNVTTKATVSYVGSRSVDDLPGTISITYKIKGAEDPYTATIEMEDGQYSPDIANIGTRRSSDKLTAVITDVESS